MDRNTHLKSPVSKPNGSADGIVANNSVSEEVTISREELVVLRETVTRVREEASNQREAALQIREREISKRECQVWVREKKTPASSP
jgi:hypothetical protein